MRFFIFTLCAAMALSSLGADHARADDQVVFYQDPIYKPLGPGDEHPMADLIRLAEGGDSRAQFILGDLYAKGKGGLVKSAADGRRWFKQSAIQGYGASYIRLAALAKREGDKIAAYSWYDLGSDFAEGKDARYAAKERDALGLTDEEEDKADELSAAWRKERSEGLKKLAEAKKATAEKEKTKEPAPEKPAAKAPSKPKKEQTPPPARKETGYNE